MFFKYVYGKIQQYPYLHIVTWGLPRRYFGLLRIFNLQIEENPQYFLKQSAETFVDYEFPSTSASTSLSTIKSAPSISTEAIIKYQSKTKNNLDEPIPKLQQGADGNAPPPNRSHRRPRKKSVVSIKINLDDDLRDLNSRSCSKNLDKILSKGSKKTYVLVIGKSSSSKRGEYSLSIVDNTAYSHPFSKLLKKNRKKKCIPSAGFDSTNISSTESNGGKVLSSTFSSENIYPPISNIENKLYSTSKRNESSSIEESFRKIAADINHDNYSDQMVGLNSETILKQNAFEKSFSVLSNKDELLKSLSQKILEPDVTSPSTALAIPSQLIPHEEPPSEDKPLRNWPIITQIFNKSNIEITKNFFKPLSSDEQVIEEDKIEEETVKDDVNAENSSTHSLQSATVNKCPKNTLFRTEASTAVNVSNSFTEKLNAATIRSNSLEVDNASGSENPNNKISANNSLNCFDDGLGKITYFEICEENLLTSSAYLLVGDNDKEDSKNDSEPKMFHNEAWKISYPKYTLTDSLINMRLLSSSMKTYESITVPDSPEDGEIHDTVEGEGYGKDNLEKGTVNETNKGKTKEFKKIYIFAFFIAIIVTAVLGIVLFITYTDSGVVSRYTNKYMKES